MKKYDYPAPTNGFFASFAADVPVSSHRGFMDIKRLGVPKSFAPPVVGLVSRS